VTGRSLERGGNGLAGITMRVVPVPLGHCGKA
jgi:hypothetical protein